MGPERLSSMTALLTNRMVVIRQSYRDRLVQNELGAGVTKENLPFEADAMYESWVNFAPHFFKEMYWGFTSLVNAGTPLEEIARCLGTVARIPRYYTHLLLPGAYLDKTLPQAEKMIFLESFSRVADIVFSNPQYDQPDFSRLFDKSSSSEEMKIALAGRLIPKLEEACESLYFGDQNIGFPKFGLIKRGIPDHTTLSQDFDLNLGVRQFPEFGRFKTYTTYSEQSMEGRLINLLDKYVGCLFLHAQMTDTKWRLRRPVYSLLVRGYVTVDGKVLNADEVNSLADTVPLIAKKIKKERAKITLLEQELEHCYVQSLPIRELGALLGNKNWVLPPEAVNSISRNETTSRLKNDWDMKYSVEVSTELIKRSVSWAKNYKSD